MNAYLGEILWADVGLRVRGDEIEEQRLGHHRGRHEDARVGITIDETEFIARRILRAKIMVHRVT